MQRPYGLPSCGEAESARCDGWSFGHIAAETTLLETDLWLIL
ncbi:MAG TPA: hypothetical protein V6D29_14800 [Leptolyngbyaceae cyanobacterium]